MLAADFGDAPDSYSTSLSQDGARHNVELTAETLFLGAGVDAETDAAPGFAAHGDDRFEPPGRDDENGVVEPFRDLVLTVGVSPSLRVRATNLTGADATLYGWIDVNQDGVFDNDTERSMAVVPSGKLGEVLTIDFPRIPFESPTGKTFARFRLSTDDSASNPSGQVGDGEVEDYSVLVSPLGRSLVKTSGTSELVTRSIGSLQAGDQFGSSVSLIGDVDSDGIDDIAVGAIGDAFYGGTSKGAVHLLYMNADHTVRESQRIGDGAGAVNSSLSSYDLFGASVTPVGDLDGNGLPDLAVGSPGDDAGDLNVGAIYILFMHPNGFTTDQKVSDELGGGPDLSYGDRFGDSITSIGDFNGDGINDLAVGASSDGTGGPGRGAVHLLFMNSDGSVKDSRRIASGVGGGPELQDWGNFGSSVASLGDINGDGVTDLAVGAPSEVSESSYGAVYVLLMQSDGQVLSVQKSLSPDGSTVGEYGASLAAIGDQDGDGITDLAIGSPGSDGFRGRVFVQLVNPEGTLRNGGVIEAGLEHGPNLKPGDRYGASIAYLGDTDGDGEAGLLVGAQLDDHSYSTTSADFGVVHSHTLLPDLPPRLTAVTRLNPDSEYTDADEIVFRVVFSEPVSGVDASDLEVSGGTSARITGVHLVDDAVYEVTVAEGDLVEFDGQVGLRLAASPTVFDAVGRQAIVDLPDVDERYFIDNTPPQLVSITRVASLEDGLNSVELRFKASFDGLTHDVDATDFVVQGAAAPLAVEPIDGASYFVTVDISEIANSSSVEIVGVGLGVGASATDAAGNVGLLLAPLVNEAYSFADFGDAPESYGSLLDDDGARHVVISSADTLFLGSSVDVDANGKPDAAANGDDRFSFPSRDDEDGVVEPDHDLSLTIGAAPRVRVRATNQTGSDAILSAWIDINQDGVFDNLSERATALVPTGASGEVFSLEFSSIPVDAPTGVSFARFRLSTDSSSLNPTGKASDGEVEDYLVKLTKPHSPQLRDSGFVLLSSGLNGVPEMQFGGNAFGSSIAVVGDLDGNGVDDIVVGAPMDHGGGYEEGAVFVLYLSAEGSVIKSVKITDGIGGGPALSNGNHFGSAIVALGDLNGDGVTDIAVGAEGGPTSGTLLTNSYGAVHILYLGSDGTARDVRTITDAFLGQARHTRNLFGASLASLGDQFGDGFRDLVVGAPGSGYGAAIALDLGVDESVASYTHLNIGRSLRSGDVEGQYGAAMASLGDLDGDGLSEIAIGEPFYDGGSANRGKVEILFPEGLRRTTLHSPSVLNYGLGLATIGDLNADGYDHLLIGSRTRLHVVELSEAGAAYRDPPPPFEIGSFSGGIAMLGDLDGDGIPEFAVGVDGAVRILTFEPDLVAQPIKAVRRAAGHDERTTADEVRFEVEFGEVVAGVDVDDFSVVGATTAGVTGVERLTHYVYGVTVAGGDLGGFNGPVGIDLAPGFTITDTSGNPLPLADPAIDEVYTIDNVSPTLLSFSRVNPAPSVTALEVIRFVATFSEPVQGVDSTDFVVSGYPASFELRQIDSGTYLLTLSGDSLDSYAGPIGIDLSPDQDIADHAGLALPQGEPLVNDTIQIVPYGLADYGDAPLSFPSLASQGGAAHGLLWLDGPRLGNVRDLEGDGQPSPLADGDGGSDDGVIFISAAVGLHGAEVIVNVQGVDGLLDAWIDFDGDGSWGGAGEQIFARTPVVVGDNLLTFDVPAWAAAGVTFVRVRLSSDGGLGYAGVAADGEVEDYAVMIDPPVRATNAIGLASSFSLTFDGVGAAALETADLDGDGDDDLIIAASNGPISWFANTGDGAFVEHRLEYDAREIVAADLDRDGDIDLATVQGDRAAWLENDGLGRFTERLVDESVDGAYTTTGLAVGDVNGDGLLDLAVTTGSDQVVIYSAVFGGVFDKSLIGQPDSTFGIVPADVDLADIDGDGALDLLIGGSSFFGKTVWFHNDGGGAFSERTLAGGRTFQVLAVDLDSDGDQDAIRIGSNQVAWSENLGAGSFASHTIGSLTGYGFNLPDYQLIATDLDGDGDVDLVASNPSNGGTFYRNDGAENFSATALLETPGQLAVSDLNNDGLLELVAGGTLSEEISILEQAPLPTVEAPDVAVEELSSRSLVFRLSIGAAVAHPISVPFHLEGSATFGADYTVEGANSLDGGVGTIIIPPGSRFAELVLRPVEDGLSEIHESIVVKLDVAPAQQAIAYILGDSDGGDYGDAPGPYPVDLFTHGAAHLAVGPTLGPTRTTESAGAHSVDATGDAGDDGVVFGEIRVGQSQSEIAVWLGNTDADARLDAWIDFNGDGSWGGAGERVIASATISPGENFLTFETPGWSSSGKTYARFRVSSSGGLGVTGGALDGEVEDYAVTILPPSPMTGRFSDVSLDTPEAGARVAVPTDFDGDGDLDIVSASSGGIVVWQENQGSAGFATRTIGSTPYPVTDLVVTDLNLDGTIDVLAVTSYSYGGAVYRFDHLGTGNFSSAILLPETTYARSIVSADMDNDGDSDIIVAAFGGSSAVQQPNIAWLENDGLGTFTQRTLLDDIGRVSDVRTFDMDRDGDIDVLVSLPEAGGVAWLENQGRSAFSLRAIADPEQPTSLAIGAVHEADLDQDGDFDILVTPTTFSPALRWYENDGEQNFIPRTMTAGDYYGTDVTAADVDGDGDLDAVYAGLTRSTDGSAVRWVENRIAGDYNNDRQVDDLDYAVWSSCYGMTGDQAIDADGNGDGTVNAADYTVWRDNLHTASPNRVFVPHYASTAFLHKVSPADIDQDGDLDIIAGGAAGTAIHYNAKLIEVEMHGAIVTEGSNDAVQAIVTRDGPLDDSLEVYFELSCPAHIGHDLAISGAHEITTGGGSILIPPLQESASILISAVNDDLAEFDEPFALAVINSEAYVATGMTRLTAVSVSDEVGGDFGDAPSPYPSLLADNGPHHSRAGLDDPRLGASRSEQSTASPHIEAGGDSSDDGVSIGEFRVGQTAASVTINVQGSAGVLDAWINFDRDGSWDGPAERIATGVPIAVGDHLLRFGVPATASAGTTYARFRLTSEGAESARGFAAVGETEDYHLTITSPALASGSFTSAISKYTSWSWSDRHIVVDIDQDGDQDVLEADSANGRVLWYVNDGDLLDLTKRAIGSGMDGIFDLTVLDADNDGDLDIAAVSRYNNRLSLLVNLGQGAFSTRTISTEAEFPMGVAAGDINGDGYQDLVTASNYDDEVAWYRNEGDLRFTRVLIADSLLSAREVATTDLDRDGDLDIVAVGSSGLLYWYENAAGLSFIPHAIPTTLEAVNEVRVVDLDRDGDLDLVASSSASSNLLTYTNDGAQAFSESLIPTTDEGLQSVSVADIDGDGDLDLLASSRGNSQTAWYENDGAGSYGEHVLDSGDLGSLYILPADFDQDGDLDLVAASATQVVWYENLPPAEPFGAAPIEQPSHVQHLQATGAETEAVAALSSDYVDGYSAPQDRPVASPPVPASVENESDRVAKQLILADAWPVPTEVPVRRRDELIQQLAWSHWDLSPIGRPQPHSRNQGVDDFVRPEVRLSAQRLRLELVALDIALGDDMSGEPAALGLDQETSLYGSEGEVDDATMSLEILETKARGSWRMDSSEWKGQR